MKAANKGAALSFALIIFTALTTARAEVVDRIVAVVGNEVITERELSKAFYADTLGLMRPDSLTGEASRQLTMEQYLDFLIQRKVIDQEVKKQGVRVDALEVEKAIDRKREGLGLTEDEFTKALAAQGISMDRYREEVKQQLISFRLISREVQGEIEVTEDEIKSFYTQHPELFMEKNKFRLLHVFIPFPGDGGPVEEANVAGQLEKIRGDIAAGAEFGGMARKYSKSPTAPSGGDLGWFAMNELLPEFREQAVALSEGEMSPVFVHGKGAHLILLAEVKKGELMPLDNVRDKIADMIYQQEAMERYDLWLERLKVRTHIENRLKEADSPHHLNP